ncbi:F-box/FBD/LRR-repeat protein At2g04230-like [Salvia hispanica]|uniref:F-box/FBD/LRR-repeat protein At2g04230-like n=1 Tax=Salvia hispanica TaxID=49212 RepID=UPI0020092C6C|nr:F-box/FBD/LRR-repeat protein At2g04230-like [Salvia hispanica]
MEEDRISQLPDEILQQILSLISIHEAVKTTILSKRWQHVWRSLSLLRFHRTAAAGSRVLSRFVSQLLSLRDSSAPVHDFHFSFDGRFPLPFVAECVAYAVSHGVRSLRLHAPAHRTLRLPAALFASTTLRELELRQLDEGIHIPGHFSLPNLKTLYLETQLYFDDYDVEREPFAGLPELERLTLRGYPIPRLVIKAPKLRVLEIFSYEDVVGEISAPLLTSFTFRCRRPWGDAKMHLPSLEEVRLNIYGDGSCRDLVWMLHQLANATTVTLTLDTIRILEWDFDLHEKSSPFPNIKRLKVVRRSPHGYIGNWCPQVNNKLQRRVIDYMTLGTLNSDSLMVEIPDDLVLIEYEPGWWYWQL